MIGYAWDKNLFGWPYEGEEPTDIVRCYFDTIYDCNYFLKALNYLVQGIGYGTDGAWANFGDMDNACEEFHFEGVEIEVGFSEPPDVMRIDEPTFFRWLRMACERYVQQNPKDKQKVEELLAQAPM